MLSLGWTCGEAVVIEVAGKCHKRVSVGERTETQGQKTEMTKQHNRARAGSAGTPSCLS